MKKRHLIALALEVHELRESGGVHVMRNDEGAVRGVWLARRPRGGVRAGILRMIAAAEGLPEEFTLAAALGDYRVVENKADGWGGLWVMLGGERAPGEGVPELASHVPAPGEPNPTSPRVERIPGVGAVRFQCPACRIPQSTSDEHIDALTGALVRCIHCGSIAHVPAAARETGMARITGSAYVPIHELAEWLLRHPELDTQLAGVYPSYGLWGFCAGCSRRWRPTTLLAFAVASGARGVAFSGHQAELRQEFDALSGSGCPDCGQSALLVIVAPVPPAIRDAYTSIESD